MRTVVRNPFARHTITAERIAVPLARIGCRWCGQTRQNARSGYWLYRFHVEHDTGRSWPIASGALFCCRQCCEAFTGQELSS